MLGVACIEEALTLRDAGATQPILLMEGLFEADELPFARGTGSRSRCTSRASWRCWRPPASSGRSRSGSNVDTGMNRLGFRPEAAVAA